MAIAGFFKIKNPVSKVDLNLEIRTRLQDVTYEAWRFKKRDTAKIHVWVYRCMLKIVWVEQRRNLAPDE